jgi:hypothetical protein
MAVGDVSEIGEIPRLPIDQAQPELPVRVEEQFLSEELGPQLYAAHKARTPMLVPRNTARPDPVSAT